ncbi:MAG: hypothetical protein H5T64_07290 [Chloroflexi bacterium]|nr:hypothetical protein [Chloroflexota bacterium]
MGEISVKVAAAIRSSLIEGQLPCTTAFRLARQLGVDPLVIGQTCDQIGVSLSRCQLGLFGYGPKAEGKHRIVTPLESVPPEMEQEIQAALEGGKLPCKAAWQIASTLHCKRLEVSRGAEALGIRISRCQLGAFE